MSASGSPSPEPIDPDRLNGWKEIASFLGKGVRTAQRWEKEYGLPVHRIGREGGEIIFASRSELTTWLENGGNRDARHAKEDDEHHAQPGGQPGQTTAHIGGRGGTSAWAGRRRLSAAAAAVVVLGLLGAWALRREPADPDHWRAAGDKLLVYDASDELVFEFDPELDLDESELARPYESRSGGHGVLADIDGDGLREVLFAAHGPQNSPNNAFYILDHDGSALANIRPVHRVTYGDADYAAPWLPHRVFLTPRPGRSPAIHVTFIHGHNFPTLLLELDGSGNTLAEYWSNGYVRTVAFLRWRGQDVLAVGAANNDFQGSSLALFESGQAIGSAPAAKDAYRCSTCSPLEPSAFVVFPRRCISASAAINGVGTVGQVWTDADGSIFVDVEEGMSNYAGHLNSVVKYTLDANLNVLRVEPTAGMFAEHYRAFREGLIDHPLTRERDGPLLFPVRVWREDGFVDLPPAPVDWSQYDARSGG